VGAVVRLNSDEMMLIRRLDSGQGFVCKEQDLVFDSFSDFEPVKGQ